jgi:hypothetical protein
VRTICWALERVAKGFEEEKPSFISEPIGEIYISFANVDGAKEVARARKARSDLMAGEVPRLCSRAA